MRTPKKSTRLVGVYMGNFHPAYQDPATSQVWDLAYRADPFVHVNEMKTLQENGCEARSCLTGYPPYRATSPPI